MFQIFSLNNKKFLKSVGKSESELNHFLSDNWKNFFPQFIFIKREFSLDGNVRSKGTSGRIDILAFNSISKKFVVIELKRDLDKNIRNQASDYKDFIEDNFADVYLLATQTHNAELPKHKEIAKDSIELILVAKEFNDADIVKAKNSKGEITLIKYEWFEDEFLLIHHLNNEPQEIVEKGNSNKNVKIRPIITTRPQPSRQTTSKNYDKFEFNGKVYGKGPLVWALVSHIVGKDTSMTYEKLKKLFPDNLISSRLGVFQDVDKAREISGLKHDRYFFKEEHVISLNDKKIVVCNQLTPALITRIIARGKELGYTISPVK